jgi:hypothetical protein
MAPRLFLFTSWFHIFIKRKRARENKSVPSVWRKKTAIDRNIKKPREQTQNIHNARERKFRHPSNIKRESKKTQNALLCCVCVKGPEREIWHKHKREWRVESHTFRLPADIGVVAQSLAYLAHNDNALL